MFSPDGSNMSFLQDFWHIMKDILELFKEIHESESFVRSFNSSFLVFIAKVGQAHNIKDFMAINLVGVFTNS